MPTFPMSFPIIFGLYRGIKNNVRVYPVATHLTTVTGVHTHDTALTPVHSHEVTLN